MIFHYTSLCFATIWFMHVFCSCFVSVPIRKSESVPIEFRNSIGTLSNFRIGTDLFLFVDLIQASIEKFEEDNRTKDDDPDDPKGTTLGEDAVEEAGKGDEDAGEGEGGEGDEDDDEEPEVPAVKPKKGPRPSATASAKAKPKSKDLPSQTERKVERSLAARLEEEDFFVPSTPASQMGRSSSSSSSSLKRVATSAAAPLSGSFGRPSAEAVCVLYFCVLTLVSLSNLLIQRDLHPSEL
jgi:hypothetical protein